MAEVIPMWPAVPAESSLAHLLERLPALRRTGAASWEGPCPCPHDTEDMVVGLLSAEASGPEWICERKCGTKELSATLWPDKPDAFAFAPSPWGFVSAADLLAEDIPDTRWLYRQMIPADSVSVIFAPPNAGKTFLALHICAEVAAAASKAGYRVAICEWEGTRKALQVRVRRACAAAGADPSRIMISHNPARCLTNAEDLAALAKECHGVDLILLDSLSAAVGDELDENDGVAQGAAAKALMVLRMAAECAVLALHHMTKAAWKPGEKPTLASLRGHSKLHGRIDTAIGLLPNDGDASVVRFELHVVKQRESEHGKPLRYEVSMQGLEATVTVEEIDTGEKADRKNDALVLTVLDFVREQGAQGASANYCEKNVRGKGTRIREALSSLHASGLIEVFEYRGFDRYRFVPREGTNWDELGRTSGRLSSSPSPFMGTRDEPAGCVRPEARPDQNEEEG